ncbi:MAG: hypothetical protein ACOCWK_10285 [Tangfeifania sp.]
MSFSVKYIELFRVQVLHHYFLDKGSLEFDSMPEEDQQKQLKAYNFQKFLNIIPTPETMQKLDGHRAIFNKLKTGFSVWVEIGEANDKAPVISFSDALTLTFLIKIADRNFLNYTDLKLSDAGRIYWFSNRRLPAEPATFPLVPLEGDSGFIDESFLLSNETATDELAKLSAGEKKNLFGILRLQMKGENATHDITTNQGEIKDTAPAFKMEFKNRETIWRYIFIDDQNVKNNDDVEEENGSAKILVTKTKKPLTQTGFIPVELDGDELPNPDSRIIKPDASSNKIFSEIYM